MNFKKNILELIGNTPLVKINKLSKGLKPQIFAKLESSNPGGSVKDRIGISMVDDAEKKGLIQPGGTLVEATSGNTGIGLALTAVVKGYKAVFVVTDKVSNEKINYLKALGSEVIVTPNAVKHDSPEYYVTVAKKIAENTPNSLFMYQYSNPSNPEVHYRTTGPEIWEQTEGRITHFVAGIGTGGTISGSGRYLKERNPGVKVIGADPFGSIFKTFKEKQILTEGHPYLVEGIGQDCIPENVHFQYIDEILNATDKESFAAARKMSRLEGIFCGGSTGTAVHIALKIAEDLDENDVVVFIVSDTGERYLSKFHNIEWLKEKRLLVSEISTLGDISRIKRTGMFRELIYVNAGDKIRDAVKVLSENNFSQLPVLNNGESVGSIREPRFMAKIIENPELLDAAVENIMTESFPVLDEDTDLNTLRDYLTKTTAVLVSEYGKIKDLITRYDVIELANM